MAKLLVLFICIAFIIADVVVLSSKEYKIFAVLTIPATLLLVRWVWIFWTQGVFDEEE